MPEGHGTPTQSLPLLLTDPVVERHGAQHVRLSDGRTAPLRDAAGEPVAAFSPGWTPDFLYAGFAPFLVLQLGGEDGSQAVWLLDGGLRRLGDTLAELGAEQAASLRMRAAPVLRRMMAEILIQPVPVLSDSVQAFLRIDAALRIALAVAGAEVVLPAPRMRIIGEIEEPIAFSHPDCPDAPALLLSRAHLQSGFATAFEDRLVQASREGMLCWPSPVDGRALRCQGCLYIDDFRFVYRFADGPANLTFYVIAADHYFKALAIYVPALDLLLVRDGWSKHLLEVFFPPNLSRWLLRQVAGRAQQLVPSLLRGAARIASVMRGPPGTHLGHQLWNELSGMEYLLSMTQAAADGGAPGPALPEWIIPGGRHGVELWAPSEVLFPELRGRVNRALDGEAAIAAYVYAQDICAVRMTRERVSAELRRRLQEIVRIDPVYAAMREQAGRSHARDAPVIVLGLRVENRTLVDVVAFFADAIAMVAQSWPGATLVIDGHNMHSAGAVIESHGERIAARAPLKVEREIAAALRARAEGLDVTLFDTLGESVATSLAWVLGCDCFLSIWGASLSKFRWVCNKPGLVVTSRDNLLERDDLHIYDLPRYMETPTRLVFADPASVVDDPEAPLLAPVAVGNRFFANFRVDHDRVLAQFRTLLNEIMTAR